MRMRTSISALAIMVGLAMSCGAPQDSTASFVGTWMIWPIDQLGTLTCTNPRGSGPIPPHPEPQFSLGASPHTLLLASGRGCPPIPLTVSGTTASTPQSAAGWPCTYTGTNGSGQKITATDNLPIMSVTLTGSGELDDTETDVNSWMPTGGTSSQIQMCTYTFTRITYRPLVMPDAGH